MRVRMLLRCYPPTWRERYEPEMTAVLEQHQISACTWLDLLRGAVDARLDPAFAGRLGPMMARLRRSEIVVFCSFVAFFIAGVGFQKMTEDAVHAGVMGAHFSVSVGYYLVIAGAVVAGLSVLAGGAPLGLELVRQVIRDRRRDLLGLLAVPIALCLAVIGFGAAVAQQHKTIDSALVRSLIVFTVVAIAVSGAALSLAVARAEVSEASLRIARIPALIAALSMAVSLIGVVVWGLSLRSSAPGLFALNGGTLRSYAYFTWVRVVALMGAATIASIAAVWRASAAGNTRQHA